MYSYYLIALHGGKELQKKIIFWKRSLTILQMVMMKSFACDKSGQSQFKHMIRMEKNP